jgi:hypothetical protein
MAARKRQPIQHTFIHFITQQRASPVQLLSLQLISQQVLPVLLWCLLLAFERLGFPVLSYALGGFTRHALSCFCGDLSGCWHGGLPTATQQSTVMKCGSKMVRERVKPISVALI